MNNDKRIFLINLIDFSVLIIILIFLISGSSSLIFITLVFHLIFLFIFLGLSFIILYCAYTKRTIPYKNKRVNARQLTITLGILLIIVLINSLVFYTEESRFNIHIRTNLGGDIILIIIAYLALGILSIIAGIRFKDNK